ncbi:MAG: undecaprenyl-diphosphatase UppP [Tenericutes bacterium]|jgi:undecaprenyl-diphosphatase|nr:undecaprenyl-diphosphatase UppP [Mycoplasmatota bacterium]
MLEIIILGIIQGIAEFLPISSSAHLIVFRDLFNIGSSIPSNVTLIFDIALHFGTLLAISIYFYKDFINMITKGLTMGIKDKSGKLFWYIVLATIPAAIIGFLFEDIIDGYIRSNLLIIAIALIIMGIIIYIVDKKSPLIKELHNISMKEAFLIGCSQILALIPGFSRSGTTIATGRLLKLDRESAAKFSFYLSAPIVAGATIIKLLEKETLLLIQSYWSIFIIGILVSFIIGLLCIAFLLKYLKKHDFKIFMWYRLLLGIVIIILTLI